MGDQDIPVGSPAFFAALLAHIEDATFGKGIPIDHVILQSILLCSISGNKHLLLRTAEEDVPLVLKVATTVRPLPIYMPVSPILTSYFVRC